MHCNSEGCSPVALRRTGKSTWCKKGGRWKGKAWHNACGDRNRTWRTCSASLCLPPCIHHTWMGFLCTQTWACVGGGWSGISHCISWLLDSYKLKFFVTCSKEIKPLREIYKGRGCSIVIVCKLILMLACNWSNWGELCFGMVGVFECAWESPSLEAKGQTKGTCFRSCQMRIYTNFSLYMISFCPLL